MRIGLLGGTFNPVHRGHLGLAEGALQHLGLDEVVWIPAHLPPHKEVEGTVSPEDRARMMELAIGGRPEFSLSRVELNRPPPSYTVDTVRQLRAERPDPRHEWFFLLGADAAGALSGWKEIDRLKGWVRFAAVPRPGSTGSAAALPEGVLLVPVETVPVSSSEIRRKIRAGEPIAGLVPEPVRRYIEEKGLYR
jgi:nicotinate-nucleotide adenylyltransferase